MVAVSSSGARTALRIVVVGRVQGVGYRWYARECGRRLLIAGRVSNQPDGTVLVEAAGSSQSMQVFMEQLRSGPGPATVADLRTEALASDARLPDPFSISR